MTIELREGNATGKASMQVSQNEVSVTGTCSPGPQTPSFSADGCRRHRRTVGVDVHRHVVNSANHDDHTVVFNGSLSGTTITGTVRIASSSKARGPAPAPAAAARRRFP